MYEHHNLFQRHLSGSDYVELVAVGSEVVPAAAEPEI
jgi:hypothetical protein